MGEVVGAAILAHVPTIMLPKEERYELNEGKEISLVPGLQKLRKDVFETLDYDTVMVMDSHWATTVEFVISAHALCRQMVNLFFAYRQNPVAGNLQPSVTLHGNVPGMV